MLDHIPVWLLSLSVIAAVVTAMHVGYSIGQWVIKRKALVPIDDEGIGTVIGSMLGLLAFMLALTFSMATSRRDSRKELLLAEVNSIGTTYLRTGLIPEPARQEARAILRKYVDLRLQVAEHPETLETALRDSVDLQKQLWRQAESLAEADLKNADIVSLFVDSVNQTIDLQTSRLTVSGYRIPSLIWLVFGGVTLFTATAVGYHFGLKSSSKKLSTALMLGVSLASVTFLIFDLDRGNQGWLQVDQQPMYDLRQQMDR